MVDCQLVSLAFCTLQIVVLIDLILETLIVCALYFQASPRLRFNKEGSLLAVTTSDNGIKILANTDGQRMLRMLESRAFDGARGHSEVNVKVIFSFSYYLISSLYA